MTNPWDKYKYNKDLSGGERDQLGRARQFTEHEYGNVLAGRDPNAAKKSRFGNQTKQKTFNRMFDLEKSRAAEIDSVRHMLPDLGEDGTTTYRKPMDSGQARLDELVGVYGDNDRGRQTALEVFKRGHDNWDEWVNFHGQSMADQGWDIGSVSEQFARGQQANQARQAQQFRNANMFQNAPGITNRDRFLFNQQQQLNRMGNNAFQRLFSRPGYRNPYGVSLQDIQNWQIPS